MSRAPKSGWPLLVCGLAMNACGEPPAGPTPDQLPPDALFASVIRFGFDDGTTYGTATAYWQRNRNGFGKSLDVSDSAKWESSAPEVVAVVGPARIVAVSPGDAEVRVSFSTYYRPTSKWSVVSATLLFRVFDGEPPLLVAQPPDIRDMTGSVRDDAGRGISGVTVEIVEGHNAGRSAVTNINGGYRFETPFICGRSTFRAARTGYRDTILSEVLCDWPSPRELPDLVMQPIS